MSNSPKTTTVRIFHILIMTFVGVLIGVTASVVSNLIYLVFLFPIGIGFLGAMSINKTVKKAKIWKPFQGMLLGTFMALVIYGAYQYSNYLTFRMLLINQMNLEMMQAIGKMDFEVANVFADYALKEETGFSGFIGYVLFTAAQGLSVGKIFSINEINIGSFFTWLYWLAEFGLIAWITSAAGKIAARGHFINSAMLGTEMKTISES